MVWLCLPAVLFGKLSGLCSSHLLPQCQEITELALCLSWKCVH